MPDVRPATTADLPAMGRALADAFADDPAWRHLVPRDTSWQAHAAREFQVEAANHLRHGEVYVTEGIEAAAIWAPPGLWKPTLGDLAKELPAAVRLFGRGLPRALATLARMEKHHPKDPPHFYLYMIGTAPDHQGKGCGSALLQPVLERCDAEGLPAYLESSKEANIAFYARHGFVEREPYAMAPDGPNLWPMWREPKS